MNILIIEDNPLKREKVHEFLSANYAVRLSEAASYNSGLNLALSEKFDLVILDMSMPTFDRTDVTHGGRFRTLAGKEIVLRLEKQRRLVPFVILTGYSDFSFNSQSLSIAEIDESLLALGDKYFGCVLFDAAESIWKDKLSEIIDGKIK
jgi:DNA-binding NarL/FixJ family response regulator